jgi:APA family basic amino acid/polyamine antiporter
MNGFQGRDRVAEEASSDGQLRRDVTVWGSFMWGYADVGADIYTALGLVAGAAMGATPVAFAVAGIVYLLVGLAYTELASSYPVAGGGQYFTLRGIGDFWGFVCGAALLLDYTIDISLFAVSSSGYFNFFLPALGVRIADFAVAIGPFQGVNLLWLGETLAIIVFLVVINVIGIKISSRLNEVLGVLAIIGQVVIVLFGFVFAWDPNMMLAQITLHFPSLHNFMYGSSLAIISFVGLESISQVSQETRRPATIVPRTSISLVFNVLIFALAFSVLGMGLLPWQVLAQHAGDPIAVVAQKIPIIGVVAAPMTALIGGLIVLISSNSGVMSASRLTYSMSTFSLLPKWFNAVHPRYHTPHRTILVFSAVAMVEAVFAFMTSEAMNTLGNMYAFGATAGYMLVFIALIVLRFKDPYSPRPYRMPLNFKLQNKEGRAPVQFPLLAVFGFLGVATILFEVILTHKIGRIAGPAWIIVMLVIYFIYRQKERLPRFGSVKRDWEDAQRKVLREAEEYELLSEYEAALAARDGEAQP